MNSPSSQNSNVPPTAAKMPGETVRGLVSLWILFHLLGVFLALATDTNTTGGSQLLARVKRTPFLEQYIYALWLDVNYGYRLTGGEQDGDYTIDTDLVYADGHRETKPLEPDDAHGERLERYQAFARRAAPPPDADAPDSTIPAFLGGAILKQLKDEGVKEVDFRLRRHVPLSMADAAASVSSQRDPFNPRTYSELMTASVTLNSSDVPQVQIKAQSARDVAPVTGTRSSTRKPNPQLPASQPPTNPSPANLLPMNPDNSAPAPPQ